MNCNFQWLRCEYFVWNGYTDIDDELLIMIEELQQTEVVIYSFNIISAMYVCTISSVGIGLIWRNMDLDNLNHVDVSSANRSRIFGLFGCLNWLLITRVY